LVEDSRGSKNHILDGVQIPHGKEQFCGGKGHQIVKYRDTLQSRAKMAEPIEMSFVLWDQMGRRNHALDGDMQMIK